MEDNQSKFGNASRSKKEFKKRKKKKKETPQKLFKRIK